MKAKAALGAVLLVAAIGLTGGGFYAMHSLKQKRFDPETLCPAEGARAVTLILIDKTDPLTAVEQDRIRSFTAAARDTAQRGERITIKLLRQKDGANETVLDTVADLCNPGADANPLLENPKRVAARYRNAFLEPIEAALAGVKDVGSAPASPIAEALHTSVEGAAGRDGRRLTLILISDMMEHTAKASAYSGTLNEGALRRLIPQTTQARLKEAEVRICLLARPRQAKQQEAAIAVWRRFFEQITGRAPSFERL
jgi:hypothetical protein